jgi:ComF family protein
MWLFAGPPGRIAGGIGAATRRGVDSALDLLFPPRCAACGASGALFCPRCRATIRAPEPPLCPRCGRSLAVPASRSSSGECLACALDGGLTSLDGLRAACVYEGSIRQAILALKFRRVRRLAVPLAVLLAAGYAREALHVDLVMPVPLHRGRRRERGYDQAELLARSLAGRLRLPLRADLLVRQRPTAPQTALAARERRANVAGAFSLRSPAAGQELAGKRLLLLDDVTTTGSTLDAAAAALRQASPAAIWGLAVARPPLATPDTDTALSVSHSPAHARQRAGA